MKKRIVSFSLAALLLAGLAPTAGAAYIGSVAEPAPAATLLQHSYAAGTEDAAGALSFGNIEPRMRAGNPTLRSAQATLDAQLAFNQKYEYDNLLRAINNTVDYAVSVGGLSGAATMSASISAMRTQLDAISEKNWGETIEKIDRQINHVISQLVMGAESLYVNILTTENTLQDLGRTMQSLDRTKAEMQLRYDLGQISSLTLAQFQATYASTESQVESLRLAVSNMKATLENLLGEPVTGTITLTPLPSVSADQKQIAALDGDKALLLAKEKSFTLYDAKKTLEDAGDDWKDARRANPIGSSRYQTAEQTYQAAVYTYEATVKNFELSVRNLKTSIDDANRALLAAESDAAYKEKNYEAQALRHKLGQISDSAFQTAQNERLAAQTALASAEIGLFAAYHNYSWAINYGIVS